MKNFSDALLIEKNKLASPYPWVPLIHFAFPSSYEIWLAGDLSDVTYQGQVYTAYNIEVKLPDDNVDAVVPTCQIIAANQSRAFEEIIINTNGGVDYPVTVTIVNTNYLTADYADLTWNFYVLQTTCTNEAVVLECSLYSPLDRKFPPDRFFASTCRYKYFKGAECKYDGVQGSCDRSIDTCRDLMYNIGNFGGFPGIQESNIAYLFTKRI
jgi:phage-related protein